MSSDTTYQNDSAENAESSDATSITTGPDDGSTIEMQQVDREIFDSPKTYYNTEAEYAPVYDEGSITEAVNDLHVAQRPDDKTNIDDSVIAEIPPHDATNETPTVHTRQQSTKKSRKVPSFYDDQLYSMVGPGDRTSSNGSHDDTISSSPSLSNKKRPKKKIKECLKCGIPSVLVFLTTIGVAIILHHFGMFPNINTTVKPGR